MPASGRFQSTPPVRGATGRRVPKIKTKEFQSTPPVRGATKKYKPCSYHLRDFNPRSPCGERRQGQGLRQRHHRHFNPRSPCGERLKTRQLFLLYQVFQSTPPVRGATHTYGVIHHPRHFNPRPPCGERLGVSSTVYASIVDFNPRPRAESDALQKIYETGSTVFQSTLPVRGATVKPFLSSPAIAYFNPRSPCGERPWGARRGEGRRYISIHAPRAGSDDSLTFLFFRHTYFNPRSPCGERPYQPCSCRSGREIFQSTLPVRGATNEL